MQENAGTRTELIDVKCTLRLTSAERGGVRAPSIGNERVKTFEESIEVVDLEDASYFAADLFKECFGSAFPTPRDYLGLPHQPRGGTWHQYVAFYKWTEANIEPVGFCNWIRHGDVYLEGGMCVRRNFYRRLPKEHWDACKDAGGVAQIIMESAARELTDCTAWFGYCGDKKALVVDLRVGYEPTHHEYLIVKWLADISEGDKRGVIDGIAEIGPF